MRQEKLISTRMTCHCGGEIKECISLSAAKQSELHNTIPLHVELHSEYISCSKCSVLYGEPRYRSILKTLDVAGITVLKWEISLIEKTIAKEFNNDDILKQLLSSFQHTPSPTGIVTCDDQASPIPSESKKYVEVRLVSKQFASNLA